MGLLLWHGGWGDGLTMGMWIACFSGLSDSIWVGSFWDFMLRVNTFVYSVFGDEFQRGFSVKWLNFESYEPWGDTKQGKSRYYSNHGYHQGDSFSKSYAYSTGFASCMQSRIAQSSLDFRFEITAPKANFLSIDSCIFALLFSNNSIAIPKFLSHLSVNLF